MLYCLVLCSVVLVLRCAVSCRVVLCCFLLCCVVLCYVALHCVGLCCLDRLGGRLGHLGSSWVSLANIHNGKQYST